MEKMQKSGAARGHGPQVLPRRFGQQVPVVHHRRALEKVGQEGLPRERTSAAVEKLWEAIPPDGARHEDNDPMAEWEAHDRG